MKQDAQDPKDQTKEVKKLFDAQIAVLTHKLGRAPTLEEITQSLSEGPQQAQEEQQMQQEQELAGIPKVLLYKVYYGMRDRETEDGQKVREPDPSNILFYQDPRENRYYDVSSRTWLETEPPIVKHLHVRDMEDTEDGADIRDAIIHGVMDDDDFNSLCNCPGMIDDRTKKLYQLMREVREAKDALETMVKSEDSEESPQVMEESGLEDRDDSGNESGGVNVPEVFMDTTGVPDVEEDPLEVEEDPLEVEDLPSQAKASAMGPGVEKRIREWIRQELELMKDEIREEMWSAINSSLQEEIQSTQEAMFTPETDELDDVVEDIEGDDFSGPEDEESQPPQPSGTGEEKTA